MRDNVKPNRLFVLGKRCIRSIDCDVIVQPTLKITRKSVFPDDGPGVDVSLLSEHLQLGDRFSLRRTIDHEAMSFPIDISLDT